MSRSFSITIEVHDGSGEIKTLAIKTSQQDDYAHVLGEALSWACVQTHGEDHWSQGLMLGESISTSLIFSKDRVAKQAWLSARANILGWAGEDIEDEETSK